jgi:hypothetical protein
LLYSAITSQKQGRFFTTYDRKKLAFIENAIQKTANLEVLLGMVLALFIDEYLEYIKMLLI